MRHEIQSEQLSSSLHKQNGPVSHHLSLLHFAASGLWTNGQKFNFIYSPVISLCLPCFCKMKVKQKWHCCHIITAVVLTWHVWEKQGDREGEGGRGGQWVVVTHSSGDDKAFFSPLTTIQKNYCG